MRKIFTLLLLLIPLWVQAQDDDIWDEGSKTLTVTLGETTEYSSYKDQAEHLVIKAGTSTEIPNSAFNGWSKLQSIIMEEGVTSIGEWAFYGCSSLTSITIPNSVTSIGSSAFQNCSSLTSITIPDNVTSIGISAFQNCSSLASITIPGRVTSIGEWAFYGCSSLASITIPDNVTSIESSTFQNCSSLASITIPDNVTSIGSSAFSGCTSLASITIPDNVTSIESSVFYNCSSLASITIPDNVTNIGYYAFSGCTSLASITIPGSVTSIGSSAFNGCTSLASITIPGSVTNIGSSAFKSCTSLTSITIPSSVTKIDNYVFQHCTSLASITIPGSVTSIGYYAFNGCSALTSIIYEGITEPTTIGLNAFSEISTEATVTVPADYTGNNFGSFSGDKLKRELYAITINATTNGSITATVDEEAVKYAKKDATVTLTVTPDDEYILGTLTVTDKDGNPVTVTGNTFTMPASNVTISATFTEKFDEPEEPETPVIPDMPDYYNIMVEECKGVTVETSSTVVREGQSMTFTIDIAEGYTDENMTVKVKRSLFGIIDIIEPNDEGIYEIKNIYTDIYITVDGVEEEEEENPTGMEDVESAKVYTKDGSIYVQTPTQEQVRIISISGAVVKNETQIGLQRYDLPKGIYIICIREERFKVRN